MFNEAQEICEKKIAFETSGESVTLDDGATVIQCELYEFTLFETFPWWKNHLEKLKNRGTLEGFNELYDILVLLQELPERMVVTKPMLDLHLGSVKILSKCAFEHDDIINLLKVIVDIFDYDGFESWSDYDNCSDSDSLNTEDILSDLSDLDEFSGPGGWYNVDFDDDPDDFWYRYAMKD